MSTLLIVIHTLALTLMAVTIVGLYMRVKALRTANANLYEKSLERLNTEKGERKQREWYEEQIRQLKEQLAAYQEAGKQANQPTEQPTGASAVKPAHPSGLADDDKAQLALKISKIMETDAAIYSPEFTLLQLSDMVDSNYKYVSQVINQVFQKNFHALLNEYRISEACRRIIDTEQYGHLTIEAIAESIGFKSRTSFIATFKKIVGIPPSEYQKMAQKQPNGVSIHE